MTNDLDRDLRDTFHRHEQDVFGRGAAPSPSMFRRIRRRQTGTVLMAAAAAGTIAIAGIAGLGATRASEQTPVLPGPTETGPTETGPAATGAMEVDFAWLPPKGAEPSTPAEGKLVAEDGGIHPWRYVQVYADGRVIWLTEATTGWLERRLTPEGVELVRSGAVQPEDVEPPSNVPESAWEDPEARPYVPSRYVVCLSEETMRLLPQRTQDLLGGYTDEQAVVRGEVDYLAGGHGVACPAVTIEEARTLDKSFLAVGLGRIEGASTGTLPYGIPPEHGDSGTPLYDFDHLIEVIPLLPNGTFQQCCPG